MINRSWRCWMILNHSSKWRKEWNIIGVDYTSEGFLPPFTKLLAIGRVFNSPFHPGDRLPACELLPGHLSPSPEPSCKPERVSWSFAFSTVLDNLCGAQMSLRIESTVHVCQRNMASAAKKWSDAKLAAAPGSLVFGGAYAWGLFGRGNMAPRCLQAFFQNKNKCSLQQVNISRWLVMNFMSHFAFQNVHCVTVCLFSDRIFPLLSHYTYSRVSEHQHYWYFGPENFLLWGAVLYIVGL